MRFWCFTVVSTLLLASCVRRAPVVQYERLTGTCEGACNYYLACKQAEGDEISENTQQACVLECNEVFNSKEPIVAFESLACEDAVAFVEGSSGRAPGEPPVRGASQPATNASMRSSN